MIASTVSSQVVKAMAAKEGFLFQVRFIDFCSTVLHNTNNGVCDQGTLTGFKWMGNAAVLAFYWDSLF